MRTLSAPLRIALVAALALVVGGLAPWAAGTLVTTPIFGEGTRDRVTLVAVGWPVAVLGLLALGVIVGLRSDRGRAMGALAAFGLAQLYLLVAWTSDEYTPGFHIRVFERWESLEPAWGLYLATTAALVGLLATLVALPRRDPWRGAYF